MGADSRNPSEVVLRLRPARLQDCEAINAIYNYYVVHSTATYQLEPDSLQEREAWLAAHGERHPVIVAEFHGAVVGWGCLNVWRKREAYRNTVENSVYVASSMHGRGIGRALMAELIRLGQEAGHHSIVAVIDAEQEASIRIHARFGFVEVGRLRELGWKFDRWLDVVYMQLLL